MSHLEMLRTCGIPEKHAQVYLSLLQHGESSLAEVAAHSGIRRTSIYNFINELLEGGLIVRVRRRKRWSYRAKDPQDILNAFSSKIEAFQSALPDLAKAFLQSQNRPAVSYLQGPDEVRSIIREELSCKKEALYIWPARDAIPMTGGLKFLTNIDRMRIKKGIWVRSIHFRDKRVAFETSGIGARYCREVRFAPPNLPITMGVGLYDSGKVGFFSSANEGFGLLIESREFYNVMKVLFSYFWARCDIPSSHDGF